MIFAAEAPPHQAQSLSIALGLRNKAVRTSAMMARQPTNSVAEAHPHQALSLWIALGLQLVVSTLTMMARQPTNSAAEQQHNPQWPQSIRLRRLLVSVVGLRSRAVRTSAMMVVRAMIGAAEAPPHQAQSLSTAAGCEYFDDDGSPAYKFCCGATTKPPVAAVDPTPAPPCQCGWAEEQGCENISDDGSACYDWCCGGSPTPGPKPF